MGRTQRYGHHEKERWLGASLPSHFLSKGDYTMANANVALVDTAQALSRSDALFGEIGDATTECDVKAALFKVETVKEALKAADMFREKSVMFARYEAYALVRVVEVCGNTDCIKGKYRKLAAEWLFGLSETERDKYVAMCEDGKTIDNVYRCEVYKPMQRSALGDAVADCKDKARNMLRNDGIVSVPAIVNEHVNDFPRAMRQEIANGVREAVRQAGGVGIGDERGTYIDPEKHSTYVSDAIATRISAVARDIESICELSGKCKSMPSFHIKGNGTQISFVDVVYLILSGLGCANVVFDTPSAKKNSVRILKQIAGDVG